MLGKFLFVILIFHVFSGDIFAGAHFLDLTKSNDRVLRKWDPASIQWRYKANGAPENAQGLIADAFKLWTEQSNAEISVDYRGTTDLDLPEADGYSDFFFDISMEELGYDENTVAVTFINSDYPGLLDSKSDATIKEADIVINRDLLDEFITTEPTDPSQLDYIEVLGHEIGHLFGLAHSFLIDSLMFPAKPPSGGGSAELKSLFRTSKRTLAQDDIAWVEALYPPDDWESTRAHVEGDVALNDASYIGAHIVAVKIDESDSNFLFYPAASSSPSVVVKGMKNVSAFSGHKGEFELKGLLPGNYRFFIQDGNNFISFSLDNVSAYLSANNTNTFFSPKFWSNPDCESGSTVTSSNVSDLYGSAPSIGLNADQWLCDFDVTAKGSGSECGSEAEVKSSCGGGGCSLNTLISPESWSYLNPAKHPGLFLVVAGFFLILFSMRRAFEARAKKFGRNSKR